MQLSDMIEPIKEDCSNLHELPTLNFVIDGQPFQLPPQAYVMRVTGAMLEADSIWDVLFFKPKMRKLDMCMPALALVKVLGRCVRLCCKTRAVPPFVLHGWLGTGGSRSKPNVQGSMEQMRVQGHNLRLLDEVGRQSTSGNRETYQGSTS